MTQPAPPQSIVPRRTEAWGQGGRWSFMDRFGIWLSTSAIRRHLGPMDGQRVADIGCGYEAVLARSLLPRVSSSILVDLQLADDLKQMPRVTAIEGRLPGAMRALDGNCVDALVCNSVLEHVENARELLHECHRVLAPGGRAFFNVPSWSGKRVLEMAAFRFGWTSSAEIDDHKEYYDPRDLWPHLVSAGFRPREILCKPHKFGLNTFAVCTKSRNAP